MQTQGPILLETSSLVDESMGPCVYTANAVHEQERSSANAAWLNVDGVLYGAYLKVKSGHESGHEFCIKKDPRKRG